jgi:hypothetical protein
MDSLELQCEKLIRALMLANLVLASMDIRHHGKDGAGAIETITLKAEKGNERLDGVAGAFDVVISASFATALKTLAEADEIAGAMVTSVYGAAPGAGEGLGLNLAYFCLEPETETTRRDGAKVRRRIVTFPTIAKLA